MEAGEKELREAFECTTTKNVKTILEYSRETRELTRKLEEKVIRLEGIIRNQDTDLQALRQQLATIQTIVFSRGT